MVLVGQPELDVLLNRYELRQVRERIALRARIAPLTKTESEDYIDHRLSLVRERATGCLFKASARSNCEIRKWYSTKTEHSL